MCFSAGASFTAGIVISAVGIATIREAHKPSRKLFACIPLLFGIQQLAEGCVWLTLTNPDHFIIQKISTLIFLLASDVLWPVMIPLTILLMEENSKRQRIIRICLFAGIALSLYYAFFLFFFKVNPEIINCHIFYNTASPASMILPTFLTYLAVTITPLFVSSVKRMWLLGIIMFMACVVTVIFYTKNVTSVWCFFGALISVIIYWILREINKNELSSRVAP